LTNRAIEGYQRFRTKADLACFWEVLQYFFGIVTRTLQLQPLLAAIKKKRFLNGAFWYIF